MICFFFLIPEREENCLTKKKKKKEKQKVQNFIYQICKGYVAEIVCLFLSNMGLTAIFYPSQFDISYLIIFFFVFFVFLIIWPVVFNVSIFSFFFFFNIFVGVLVDSNIEAMNHYRFIVQLSLFFVQEVLCCCGTGSNILSS